MITLGRPANVQRRRSPAAAGRGRDVPHPSRTDRLHNAWVMSRAAPTLKSENQRQHGGVGSRVERRCWDWGGGRRGGLCFQGVGYPRRSGPAKPRDAPTMNTRRPARQGTAAGQQVG